METYKAFKRDLLFALVVFSLFQFLYSLTDFGKDDTDPPEGRSGLAPRVDYKTGCQYLESSSGGLTPRMQKDGTHLCQ